MQGWTSKMQIIIWTALKHQPATHVCFTSVDSAPCWRLMPIWYMLCSLSYVQAAALHRTTQGPIEKHARLSKPPTSSSSLSATVFYIIILSIIVIFADKNSYMHYKSWENRERWSTVYQHSVENENSKENKWKENKNTKQRISCWIVMQRKWQLRC